MYSNDINQIKSGLTNYIGAMLKATGYKNRAASHHVVALLLEEVIALSAPNNHYDLYVLKPMIKALYYISREEYNKTKDKRLLPIIESLNQFLEYEVEKYENT